MSMMEQAGITRELLDITKKRAKRRWAAKRTVLAAGAAAVCVAMIMTGWWCMAGIPVPDTLEEPPIVTAGGPLDQPAATRQPDMNMDMRIVPLRSGYWSDELTRKYQHQQGLLCLDLGDNPGAALEQYELQPDPLLEDGSARLAAALTEGRRFWLVLKISSSGSYLFAPGGLIASSQDGGGAPSAEFTMLGCTDRPMA